MKYHLMKQSRPYGGFAYNGYSSGGVVAEAETLELALEMQRNLQEFNPVGWNIWDSETGELVNGVDIFAEAD